MVEEFEGTNATIEFFDENKNNPDKIAKFLQGIAERVQGQGNPNEVSMFGETEPETISEIIDAVKEKLNTSQQDGLKFSATGNSQNIDFSNAIKDESVANVALQLGGEIKDGHLIFKNPKDEETFRKHLQNMAMKLPPFWWSLYCSALPV